MLAPNLDAELTYAMQGVIQYGTGTAANIGRPAAGKTGTAENYIDAWFCGFVPQLATCVWVGYPAGEIPLYNVEGVGTVYGGTLPAEIWRDFMSARRPGHAGQELPDPGIRWLVHQRRRHVHVRAGLVSDDVSVGDDDHRDDDALAARLGDVQERARVRSTRARATRSPSSDGRDREKGV